MTVTAPDFRSSRMRQPAEAFAIAEGEDSPATDLIPEATWRSIVSLPDDVSLRTSDHHGTLLRDLWDLWSNWSCLVGGLQQATSGLGRDSPIAHVACDATDYLQAAIYSALVGHYRLARTSLRGVVENLTIGLHLELAQDYDTFADWLDGTELGFGWAADHAHQHARVAEMDAALQSTIGDDVFRQRRPSDEGGLARRLFRDLSKYAHGAPDFNDADIWNSNGPIYVPNALEGWSQAWLAVYALGVLLCRLAQPGLDALSWEAQFTTRSLFAHVASRVDPNSPARRLFDAVPASVWAA